MAADQAAAVVGTLTLTANTSQTIQLTGTRSAKRIELIHHGDVTNVVYYKVATTEAAADTMTGGGADEERVLLAGERLTVTIPRSSATSDVWIGLRSAGAVTVSAELIPGDS